MRTDISVVMLGELVSGKGYCILSDVPVDLLDKLKSLLVLSFKKNFDICDEVDISFEDLLYYHINDDLSRRRPRLSVFDRTLGEADSTELASHPWFQNLCKTSSYKILDAYGWGWPTFTWRITRPQTPSDIRPLHRDSWFRLTNGESKIFDPSIPSEIQTIKLWIAISVEPGRSGLYIIEGSQKMDNFTYKTSAVDGMIKPIIDDHNFTPSYAPVTSGQAILFGEDLVHGGATNTSSSCRVSFEIPLALDTYIPNLHILV